MKKTPPFDLGNACAALNDAQIHELKAIATQYHEATGVVMRVANWVGSKAEDLAKRLPDGIQGQIGWATEQALKSSYWLAEKITAFREFGNMER